MTTKNAARPPAAAATEALADIEQNSLEAAARSCSSLFGTIANAHAEVLRFLSERFRKDAEVIAQFACCRSPADIVQLQMKLGTDALADYMDETQRLLRGADSKSLFGQMPAPDRA